MTTQRPDTPLAATPEPQPVSSGMQPMNQPAVQPISKFQAAADSAIQGINNLSQQRMAQQQKQQ
jgi:hypothetical protein